ncbi:cell division protein FtsX [Bdellovibrio reynosensis]|uniref:Cell division protein FtsX n=1 Tax=Bdellovibrio reynosensis TaxID=2835041 RepID=A0ABY4CAL5_9BACT|nr:permease-like cell division protein FtsX [Bdellovibrio reynosensis]UOF00553.1 ABC transporter permease [Bdellovibrio reynosensis]
MMKAPQKNWALKVSTLIVVTACFVVMGSGLLISQNFKNILTQWGEDVQMTVYLANDLNESELKAIESSIKASDEVGQVTFVNQDKALGDFRAQLASYAPDMAKDDELLHLIPASMEIKISDNVSAANQGHTLKNLAEKFRKIDGVDEVSYGQEWVEKYAKLVSAIEATMSSLGFIILMASLFVIANVIRASIANRKEEIVVLEMIGATTSMVRKPFLIEGATLGFTSSILAIILCFGLYSGIRTLLVTKLSFFQLGEHLSFISPMSVVFFIVGGTCLGAFSSYLCIRRLNDGYAGSQG